MSGEIKFIPISKKGSEKLVDPEGNFYIKNAQRVRYGVLTQYWRCTNYNCPGRFIYKPRTKEGKLSTPHLDGESGVRAKEEALESLRQTVISCSSRGEKVKAFEIISQVLRKMPPEGRELMPSQEALLKRVRNWAREEGVEVVRSEPGELCKKIVPPDKDKEDGSGNSNVEVEMKPDMGSSVTRERRRQKGLFLLKREHGLMRVMIDGQVFVFEKYSNGKEMYRCQDAKNGCPVTALVRRKDKWFEVTGEHKHEKPKKFLKGWMACIKLVDDDGNILDPAAQSTTFSSKVLHDDLTFEEPEPIADADTAADFQDADNSLGDYDDEVSVPGPPPHKSTSLDITKSGERCFVCGDELVVSEALSSNAATFQKACRYLNVRSEKEWFPGRVENSNYYSFCESCSTEITRIHDLYKKIQGIQSLIFNKVETVEKRIADAEIVDNWMAEAPPSSAKRFEGFRNQVLINYRNKLKLRREIRMGRKMGNDFEEVQPVSSAHMFASDPARTNAFSKVVPASTSENLSHSHIKDDSVSRRVTRRTARPKCMKRDTDHVITVESVPEDYFSGVEFEGFDVSQEDAMSVHSEAELKFDPGALNAGEEQGGFKETVMDEGESSDEEINDHNDEDPDWNGEDESREQENKRSKGNEHEKSSENTTHEANPPVQRRRGRPPKSQKPKKRQKPLKFPDVIMKKDGRMFMEGIEILKNAPGAYKLHPDINSFTCGACNKIIPIFWKMREHIAGHHLGMYKCETCGKSFSGPTGLQRHLDVKHSDNNILNCPVCGQPLKGGDKSLKHHMWRHLSEEEKKDPKNQLYCPPNPDRPKKYADRQTFMCSYCSKEFFSPVLLKRHELIHTGEISYQCQFCGKVYQNYKSWYAHVSVCELKHKGIKSSKTFPCPICPKRFNCRSTKAKHMKVFHRNLFKNASLQFPCARCSKRFASKLSLNTHKRHCMNSRTGITPTHSASQEEINFTQPSLPSSSTLSGISDNVNLPSSSNAGVAVDIVVGSPAYSS